MTTPTCPLVVTEGRCDCDTVPLLHVHHRGFPELRAEGETPAIAAAQLSEKFRHLLDGPLDPRRREPVARAIADLQSFLQALGEAP